MCRLPSRTDSPQGSGHLTAIGSTGHFRGRPSCCMRTAVCTRQSHAGSSTCHGGTGQGSSQLVPGEPPAADGTPPPQGSLPHTPQALRRLPLWFRCYSKICLEKLALPNVSEEEMCFQEVLCDDQTLVLLGRVTTPMDAENPPLDFSFTQSYSPAYILQWVQNMNTCNQNRHHNISQTWRIP